MARRIAKASVEGDWQGLRAADRELAALLPELRARGTWTPEERAALALLKRTHDEARERCEQEVARIGARLSGMRDCRDGWMAYALSAAWGENGR